MVAKSLEEARELINIELGENIRKFRKEKKISQVELSKMCGFSTRTLQRYESGTKPPNVNTLNLISEKLDIPMKNLFGENPEIEVSIPDEELEGFKKYLAENNIEAEFKKVDPQFYINDVRLYLNYSILNEEGKDKVSIYAEDLANSTYADPELVKTFKPFGLVPEYQRTPDQEEE